MRQLRSRKEGRTDGRKKERLMRQTGRKQVSKANVGTKRKVGRQVSRNQMAR